MALPAAHLVPLHIDFRFVHEPLDCTTDVHLKRFVGRDDELSELVARIILSDGGAFLLTGYRGVGKSTFVNRVIQQVRAQLPELEATVGPLQFVDVHLNVPRAMNSVELMYHVLRGLYLRLDALKLLPQLNGSLRRDLELAFSRTSRTIALQTSTGLENTAGVNFTASLPQVLQSSSGFSFGTKRSASETREIAYLTYDDKAAEYDLVHIARRLSNGFSPDRSRAAALWHRIRGQSPTMKRLKMLFVFDELDKIDDGKESGASIDGILANLKTLFTTSGIAFLFVAGKDIHDRWLEDVGRGDSIYESVFSYALYLPPLWMHADPMCDPLLDGQAFGAVDATESATAYAAFKKFLAFNGRGIPRRILRKFNERVRWNDKRAQLAFSHDDVRQFKFFADLYDVLITGEAALLGELREDAWTGRADRKRLGLYYLVDWILLRGMDEFTVPDAVAASKRLSHLIAPADEAAPDIINRLLRLLVNGKYLEIVKPSGTNLPPQSASDSPLRYRLMHQRLVEMGSLAGVVEQEAQVVINESKQERFGGRYEVLSVLGRGGMSTVYLAQDKVLPRQVAIKEQLISFSDDPDARNRIRAEAHSLYQLQHENIVRVYDVNADAKQPYIVMEHVKGVCLADLIGTEALAREAAILRLAVQIVRAVNFVHERGILWRDPKPANIMITPEGRVVLLDFGISHLLASADRGAGVLLGTPTYSSPEQLRGEALDVRSDIYCIGVVLYQVVSGHLPFVLDPSPEGMARRIAARAPLFGPDVHMSEALATAIFKCLEPDRTARFQTTAELLAALPEPPATPNPLASAKEIVERQISPDRPKDEDTQPIGSFSEARQEPHALEPDSAVIRESLVDEAGVVYELRPPRMTIGRTASNDIQVHGADISRFHAEVARVRGEWLLADQNSRFGTFLNGTAVTAPVQLRHGDTIRLGRSQPVTLIFHGGVTVDGAARGARQPRLRRGDFDSFIAELRELAGAAPLERVLEAGIDRAIEMTRTERGFIMTRDAGAALTMTAARARGGISLPGTAFSTSRKIPEQVAATGEMRFVSDLLDGDLAQLHVGTVALGIRQVMCLPLRAPNVAATGVIYLDSREKGAPLSQSMRDAIQILAAELAGAIQRAHLQHLAIEETRIEQEMRIGAEIQRALISDVDTDGDFYRVVGRVIPCRAVGGDLLQATDLSPTKVAFLIGDVAGKGTAAALLASFLTATIEASAAAQAMPSAIMALANRALIRHKIASRFATAFFATVDSDGLLRYCNAGHNPPVAIVGGDMQRLEAGGMVLGLFDAAVYEDVEIQLTAGDTVIAFTDGVTEAENVDGEEFSDGRLAAVVRSHYHKSVDDLANAVLKDLETFRGAATSKDDMSLLVFRYGGALKP